ncbi:type IV pilin protein [Cerasicoccus arenae]|uniref:Uncharacterized protein n=1 Tax=Cerasicoccus arenae TaxID=424488 RepID=A0A8J3D6J2_9BACT|nr:hypothetical protein [Cerasicoccus arenae]MBK1856955.1 hypothetical protein [Cerasicoccus arenae]GHB90032.1 hypothetical protein GCM10007047_00790 [Cerasicoccus arenae]
MKIAFRYTFLIGCLVALSACSKPGKTTTSGSASSGDSIPLVPVANRSPNFEPVAARLDLGGRNYMFMDFSGAMQQAGASLTAVMSNLAQMQPDNMQMMMLGMIPYEAIIKTLGVSNLAAYGVSSYEDGSLFRNKSVVYMPDGVEGIFTISGTEPMTIAGLDMAPENTDIFVEYMFNSGAIKDMIYTIAEQMNPGNGEQFAQGFLSARANDTGPSWQEILDKSNTVVNVVVRFGDPIDVPVPEEDFTLKAPNVEFMLSMKNMAWLVTDGVIPVDEMEVSDEMGAKVYRDNEGTTTLQSSSAYTASWNPALIVQGQDIAIVSHVSFWQECLSGKTTLRESAKFQEATADFPEKGNAMFYCSDDAFNAYVDVRDDIYENVPEAAATRAMMSFYMPLAGIPRQDKSSAAIVTVDQNMIFSDSRWPTPGGAGGSMTSVSTVGLLAAMAIPAFQKVREQSREKAITNNLRQIAAAGQQYILEEGVVSVSYPKLADYFYAPIQPVNGEDYSELVISEDGGVLEVTTDNGETISFSY